MKRIFILTLFTLICNPLLAQPLLKYYWKGGTGSFNDPTMWWVNSFNSGTTANQIPSSSNNVYFTKDAFNNSNDTIYINSASSCDSMIWEANIATTPVLYSTTPSVSLDIYGSFFLTDDMLFSFSGSLRFRSDTAHRETIDTKGKLFQLRKVEFDGGNNTEFFLVHKLFIEDVNASLSNRQYLEGGIVEVKGGTLNSNEQTIDVDFFQSKNNNPNRGLLLKNSQIYVDGQSLTSWNIDFNSNTNNFDTIDLSGSKLVISPYTSQANVYLGQGISYDTIISKISDNRPFRFNGAAVRFGINASQSSSIKHLYIYNNLILNGNNRSSGNLFIDNLYLKGKRSALKWNARANPQITVDSVSTEDTLCAYKHPIMPLSSGNGHLTFVKQNGSILNLKNVLLQKVNCDISGGKKYYAYNSVDGNANSSDWVFTSTTSRELYFRENGSNRWYDLSNWQEKIGTNFTPAACFPTASDNVYFDALSLINATAVNIDSLAFCKNFTVESSIKSPSTIKLNNQVHLFGNLTACPQVTILSNSILAYGKNNYIELNGASMRSNLLIQHEADYTIVGKYKGATVRIDAQHPSSTLRMGSDTVYIRTLALAQTFMDSTQVFVYGNSPALAITDRGSTKTYTGNATIHLQPNNASRLNIRTLPNVIAYKNINEIIGNLTIEGDLTLLDNADLHPSNLYKSTSLRITGSMPLYQGDLNLTAGKVYSFSSARGSSVSIAGDLNASGTCKDFIDIQTTAAQLTYIPLTINGNATVEYCYIQGIHANQVINASYSTDKGDNQNINFNTNSGVTYYWRAHINDPLDFEGEWNDPAFWTTNANQLVGDSACIPTSQDSVIFDSQSFSATSNGCQIQGNAYCKTLLFLDDARVWGAGNMNARRSASPNKILISESLLLDANMQNFDFLGDINMVGKGDIDTKGTTLEVFKITFDSLGGEWNLRSDLTMDNSWASQTMHKRYGILHLKKGTLNTNNHQITIPAQFIATGNKRRQLNLGSSLIIHQSRGTYGTTSSHAQYPWDIRNSANLTLNAGSSQLVFENNSAVNHTMYMGNNIRYNNVRFEDNDNQITLQSNAKYGYAEFLGDTYLKANNSFDSIRLEGPHYYYFEANSTQTLNAPHGKIISNGSPTDFIHLESSINGQDAYLYKPYGYAFCIDYVKVRHIKGTKDPKATVPTSPVNYQVLQDFLIYQTGIYSDNINNTATGIWSFTLPLLQLPTIDGVDTIYLCKYGNTSSIPLDLLGTSPYFIDYNWVDFYGNTRRDTITVADDDSNPNTIFSYDLPLGSTQLGATTQMNIHLQTSRCGELVGNSPVNKIIMGFAPNTLVDLTSTASCHFNNEATWFTFMDATQEKPVISLLDKADATDNQALGKVDVQLFIDPYVKTLFNAPGMSTGGTPYLQRHWRIKPESNGPARIRLYFTQQEVAALEAAYNTSNPLSPISINNPGLDLIVIKFDDTLDVGAPIRPAFSQIAMTPVVADAFSSVNGVYAFEVPVNSFSHFAIIPVVLLSDNNIALSTAFKNQEVQLDWKIEQTKGLSHFELERMNYLNEIEVINPYIEATEEEIQYSSIDDTPLGGSSYYRVKAIYLDGTSMYSQWNAVTNNTAIEFNVYPIPCKEVLSVQLNTSAQHATVNIYNSVGQVVLSQQYEHTQFSINTAELPSGIYCMQIELENGVTKQQRFIIRH